MKFITTDKLEKLMTEVMAIVNSKFVTEDKFVNQLATKSDKDHTHNYAGSSSAGGAANSVKTNLIVKLNGGSTEGTDLFTFNGSTAKTINITPSSIGASASGHTHEFLSSKDTRNINDLPSVYTSRGLTPEFKSSSTIGLPNVGKGFTGLITYQQWSDVTNWTGGKTTQFGTIDDGRMYYRKGDGSGWGAWQQFYTTEHKPTPADIGAAAASHGTHVEFTAITPSANGTASVGTSSKVARADHVHPLQTTVNGVSFWTGTQAQYDAISSKSSTTLYFIID